MTVGFIGLGLIGGSIAKAIREKHPDTIIKAWTRRREVLQKAASDDVVDVMLPSIESGFEDCDIIFICVPVITALDFLPVLKPQLKEKAILSDVGSTKTAIHEAVEKLGLNAHFIGGHPMTGSEKIGYDFSRPILLENVYYMLTPTEDVPSDRVTELKTLIASLGSLPLVLDYREHDRIVAAVSHVPHLISAALVNLVEGEDNQRQLMKTVAAGGFRDITRISSSSPAMWQEICLANRDAILPILDHDIEKMQEYRQAVADADKDKLWNIFADCKAYRDSFSAMGHSEYSITCDIRDEEGAIADIASALAAHNINIKNMGITHNRETEGGVIRLSFWDRASLSRAIRTLKGSGYTVYEN